MFGYFVKMALYIFFYARFYVHITPEENYLMIFKCVNITKTDFVSIFCFELDIEQLF